MSILKGQLCWNFDEENEDELDDLDQHGEGYINNNHCGVSLKNQIFNEIDS